MAYSSNAALIRYQYDSLGHSITPGTPNHGDRNNPGNRITTYPDINGGNNSDNKNGEDNGEGSNPKGANGESEVDEGDNNNNNNNSGDNEDDHDTSNGGGNPSEKKKGNKPGENNGKHNDPSDSLIKINAQGLQLLNNVNALTGISNGQLKQGTHDQKDANNPDGLDNHDVAVMTVTIMTATILNSAFQDNIPHSKQKQDFSLAWHLMDAIGLTGCIPAMQQNGAPLMIAR
ncbi:hypothetical protein BDF22DRAFT_743052 [Syncephalis plumigaleata]|nr:hypothetical protein BDF22DRAFT_743052 [Syncephalis plumigaleata]